MACEEENNEEYNFMYNLEAIKRFNKFFRVEGILLGFKINLNQRLKSKCYYDFGLKYKLKGNLKNFFSWKKIFKSNLYLKSLYSKKELLNKNFCVIQKKSQNFLSLYFNNIFVNNYEKLKKFHVFKIFNRINFMFYENHYNLPLQLFCENHLWCFNFMQKIKAVFFNKFYYWFKNFSLLKNTILIYYNYNKLKLLKNFNLYFKKKNKLFFFLKYKNYFKRPFLKYVFRKICKYKIRFKKKNQKHKMKKKFKYQFRFLKKFKWKKKFNLKWNNKAKLNFLWKKNLNLKWKKRNKIYGIFLQKRFNKVFLNNAIRHYLYNCKRNLKCYYNLIKLDFKIKNLKIFNIKNPLFLKKKIHFFSSSIVWFNKPYLNFLNKFFIIILLLYKKNNLVSDIEIIIKLIIQFKYYLLKLINKLWMA